MGRIFRGASRSCVCFLAGGRKNGAAGRVCSPANAVRAVEILPFQGKEFLCVCPAPGCVFFCPPREQASPRGNLHFPRAPRAPTQRLPCSDPGRSPIPGEQPHTHRHQLARTQMATRIAPEGVCRSPGVRRTHPECDCHHTGAGCTCPGRYLHRPRQRLRASAAPVVAFG